METHGQLGRLIQDRLRRRHMPVAKLADQAGLSTASVYKILRGETAMPYRRTIERLADSLGMPATELWDAAMADNKPDEHRELLSIMEYDDGVWIGWTKRLIAETKTMSAEQRDRLRSNLAAFVEFEASRAEAESPEQGTVSLFPSGERLA